MTKHTPAALRAAERIDLNYGLSISLAESHISLTGEPMSETLRETARQEIKENLTAIINSETAAERERLRAACEAALRFMEIIDQKCLPEPVSTSGAPLTMKLRAALANAEPESGEKDDGS